MAFLRSWPGMVLVVSLAVGAFFLVAEHRVHLTGFLPYALVALFMVFHVFMHAGHGGHGGLGGHTGNPQDRGSTKREEH
jgi:hypothetical protein